MYSINFDFFFNIIYNFLLAIRYGFLFWILRIDPKTYLADHQYDSWDGLRDRGWISASSTNPVSTTAPDLSSTSVYLGSVNESWWGVFKSHVFSNGVNNKFISYSGDMSQYNAANPADVNFAAQQVNNDPWFQGLHLSIQNPILSFCADIISTFAFFILLIFIYTMFQWLFITFASKRKEREKARLAKIEARRKILRERAEYAQREENVELEKENQKRDAENKIQKAIEKRDHEPIGWWDGGDLPEGLPIDEEELGGEVEESLEQNRNNILNYSEKNKDINKSNLIKISDSDDNKQERNSEAEKKQKDYKNRWDIVLNYAAGVDEALWRVGILEADNLLNDLLVDRGYEGVTVADRLSNANFKTLDLAWAAHKIRNRIAHDGSRFVITDRIARNTFDLFKAVFTEFKVFE